VLAAAWCLRVVANGASAGDAADGYRRLLSDVRALDPYATTFCARPPWQLVLSVLERLPFAAFATPEQR
jgi:hypothetical protein